jgi:hypothetical protein
MLQENYRKIPLSTYFTVLLGDVMTQVGLGLVAFGYIFVVAFTSKADFDSFSLSSNSPTTQATLTKIEATNSKVNKQRIYAYFYTFSVAGQTFTGTSYETHRENLLEGTTVNVQYVAQNPQISCIEGMRNAEFPAWAAFMVLIFPLVGIGLAYVGFKKGVKAVTLLKYGVLTRGKLTSSVPTATKVNGRAVHEMTFEFTAQDNKTYQMIAKTHQIELLQDEQTEGILYVAENPHKAMTLDEMPSSPRFENSQQIAASSTGKTLLYLISPTIVLFELLLTWLLW